MREEEIIFNKEYVTKNNQNVYLRLFNLSDNDDFNENNFKNEYCIVAYIAHEMVGHIKFSFLDENVKNKMIPNAFMFWIHQYMSDDVIKKYEQNNLSEFGNVLFQKGLIKENNIINVNDFIKKINELERKKYNKFIDLYLSKGMVDNVQVYKAGDVEFKLNILDKSKKVQKNYQNLGIGNILHEVTCAFLSNKNINLWESNNKTTEGEILWNSFKKKHSYINVDGRDVIEYKKSISLQNAKKII